MSQIRIESGVPPGELEAWFLAQARTRQGNTYQGAGWQAVLSFRQPRRLGVLTLPVTVIMLEGEHGQKLAEAYRLHFLSAGG